MFLLLATFQMLVSSPQNDLKIVPFNTCPNKWIITCVNAKAVLRCWKDENKIKLRVKELQWNCEDARTYLNIKINNINIENGMFYKLRLYFAISELQLKPGVYILCIHRTFFLLTV
ncbi:hypothetical protein XENORESO_007209 [Xenotaenia resolanae]|uniref:Uncharacterized protein n=1 Tax=Xenotaenia resolanae TaxID=208358 RepID=A0ABV0X4G7_9TELE